MDDTQDVTSTAEPAGSPEDHGNDTRGSTVNRDRRQFNGGPNPIRRPLDGRSRVGCRARLILGVQRIADADARSRALATDLALLELTIEDLDRQAGGRYGKVAKRRLEVLLRRRARRYAALGLRPGRR